MRWCSSWALLQAQGLHVCLFSRYANHSSTSKKSRGSLMQRYFGKQSPLFKNRHVCQQRSQADLCPICFQRCAKQVLKKISWHWHKNHKSYSSDNFQFLFCFVFGAICSAAGWNKCGKKRDNVIKNITQPMNKKNVVDKKNIFLSGYVYVSCSLLALSQSMSGIAHCTTDHKDTAISGK